MKTLSGALGHYSAGFTLNTYTHATTQMKQDVADTIGAVVSQAMEPQGTTSKTMLAIRQKPGSHSMHEPGF